MQRDLMPTWIKVAAAVNPADRAVQVGRGAVAGDIDWSNAVTMRHI